MGQGLGGGVRQGLGVGVGQGLGVGVGQGLGGIITPMSDHGCTREEIVVPWRYVGRWDELFNY